MRRKTNNEPKFYYSQLLERIDMAKGGFFQDNQYFVITASSETDEEIIQIVHRQMADETQSEDGIFGLSLCVNFDDSPEEQDQMQRFKQSKYFGLFIKGMYDGITCFTTLLPHESTEAATIASDVLMSTYKLRQQDKISFDLYDAA
mgnify:CR=1 FL=1